MGEAQTRTIGRSTGTSQAVSSNMPSKTGHDNFHMERGTPPKLPVRKIHDVLRGHIQPQDRRQAAGEWVVAINRNGWSRSSGARTLTDLRPVELFSS